MIAVAEFVERVRAQRAEAQRPRRIEDEGIYRILDGILAARRREA